MPKLRTKLEPWSARLLAIVAAAPLLHCGGISEGGGRDDGSGATGGATGTTGSGGTHAKPPGATGSGGFVSGGAGGQAGGISLGGVGASSGAGGDIGGTGGFPCLNPAPTEPDFDSGYERCEGFTHRPRVVECRSNLPTPYEHQRGEEDQCSSDADCADGPPHSYCGWEEGLAPLSCLTGCTTDDECDEGSICECWTDIGKCVRASCTSDADCGPGLLCATAFPYCREKFYACQHPEDECMDNADCSLDQRCSLDETGVRRCVSDTCGVIGRPFLVAEETRLARSTGRTDWKACDLSVEASSLSEAERAALGAAWLRNALMEHASVAAFARFTLELLAVGAPADLIRDSNAAASDETRHAELCFALASEYLGEPVGPGPLKIEGALDGLSLEKLLVTTIAEGCVGETVAAIEAAEQLGHASNPVVKSVLSRISEDETRHAELAWRFVTWALEQQPSLRAVAEREFERHLSTPVSFSDGGELDLSRHGVLTARTRAELRRAVLDDVVRPSAAQLMARPARCARTLLTSSA